MGELALLSLVRVTAHPPQRADHDHRNPDEHIAHGVLLAYSAPSAFISWTAAGPRIMMSSAGSTRNTSGKAIFTAALRASCSARCRRFTRIESAWARSAFATLVPSRSVWMSIATSE